MNKQMLSECPFCGGEVSGGDSFSMKGERIYFCIRCTPPLRDLITKEGAKSRKKIRLATGVNILVAEDGSFSPTVEAMRPPKPAPIPKKKLPAYPKRKKR